MQRRRSDLGLGLLTALALHGLLFAAAGSILRSAPMETGQPTAQPLEVRMIDESAWRAQMDSSAALSTAQPLEARVRHAVPVLPVWPRVAANREHLPLEVARRPAALREDLESPAGHSRVRERLVASRLEPRQEEFAPRVESRGTNQETPAPAASQPMLLGTGSALVLQRPALRYPSRPLRRGVEGVVRIGIELAANGDVARAWVVRSAGNRELDRSALRYLREWRFDMIAVRRADCGLLFRSDVRFEIE